VAADPPLPLAGRLEDLHHDDDANGGRGNGHGVASRSLVLGDGCEMENRVKDARHQRGDRGSETTEAGIRLLVTGGRYYSDLVKVSRVLWNIHSTRPIGLLIEGGCPTGLDALARLWAAKANVPWQTFEADWRKHGNAAGPIRNQVMIDEGKPDFVAAFLGDRGTADMVIRATKAGLQILDEDSRPLSVRHPERCAELLPDLAARERALAERRPRRTR
jgi:YspA, cpYpsA-related SLOG family